MWPPRASGDSSMRVNSPGCDAESGEPNGGCPGEAPSGGAERGLD